MIKGFISIVQKVIIAKSHLSHSKDMYALQEEYSLETFISAREESMTLEIITSDIKWCKITMLPCWEVNVLMLS